MVIKYSTLVIGLVLSIFLFRGSMPALGNGIETQDKGVTLKSTEVASTDGAIAGNISVYDGSSDPKPGDGHDHQHAVKEEKLKADFEDFPTLHPLVVHFPIVLLLLAAISQLAGLLVFKRELSWVTLVLVAGGFIGAFVAANYVHPHTTDLSEYAERILKEHEKYADYTLWIGGIALLFKAIAHFFLGRKLWSEIVLVVMLFAASYCVGIAAHFGSQLLHIEGVGAKGQNLELHSDDGHSHEH
jgi:uncharacterized membrane protein